MTRASDIWGPSPWLCHLARMLVQKWDVQHIQTPGLHRLDKVVNHNPAPLSGYAIAGNMQCRPFDGRDIRMGRCDGCNPISVGWSLMWFASPLFVRRWVINPSAERHTARTSKFTNRPRAALADRKMLSGGSFSLLVRELAEAHFEASYIISSI